MEQSETPGGDQGRGRDPRRRHERQQIRANERTHRMASSLYGPPRNLLLQNQPTNPPQTLQKNQPTPQTNHEPLDEDHVAIYRCPSAGRGLGETHVTVRPDWTGFPRARPFWAGFRPCPEIATSTRVRKVDGGEATFPTSGFRLRQWCAVAREPRAASAMVPWITMGDVKIKESDLLT